MSVATVDEAVRVLIKFRIFGNLRFLSHAETARMFERACVRAGICLCYSQGFNPHPRISLPLPRPVGVESEGELLSIQVPSGGLVGSGRRVQADGIKAGLAAELPAGCELMGVNVVSRSASVEAVGVQYVLPVRRQYTDGAMGKRISEVLSEERLVLQRRKGGTKVVGEVDVRGFLESMRLAGTDIVVDCKVSRAGTVRVDEIMWLLGLDVGMLAGPVRRLKVEWKIRPE